MNRFRALRYLACASVVTAAAFIAVPFATPTRAADAVTRTRALPTFDRIHLNGAFTADIVAGEQRSDIVISGDPAVVDSVTTSVRGGTLDVGMREGGMFHSSPKLVIKLATLRGFANDGAGKVKIAGLTGGDVEIGGAGAGSLTAAGRASSLTIKLDGAGKIDTTALAARDVTVDNNGVGGVYVRASGSLTMNVNGVGEIRYAGDPAHVESHVNGIGRIGRI